MKGRTVPDPPIDMSRASAPNRSPGPRAGAIRLAPGPGRSLAVRAAGALVAVVATGALLAGTALAQGSGTGPVYRVPITGVIELGLAPFVERTIREAEEAGARAVILDVDTPGGRVDAAQRIADALSDAGVPTYAYVNRRAFSAGALISLATDRIYMRPGSSMGAATPVGGAGERAPEKIVSAMRSEMRALAEARGLDPAIAESMVDETVAVPGVVDAGRLLTLTTEEAVRVGFALETEDFRTLLDQLGLEQATVVDAEVNWAERVVRFLSHPVVAPFLLTLGFLGLLTEIKTPSFGVAGAAGVLALVMFFGSHLILGLAGWEAILIFGLGLGLLALEVFLIPGFGIFGVLGAIGVLAGLFMSLIGSLPTMPDFTRAGAVLSTTILLTIVTTWALLRHLPRSGRLAQRGIFLASATDREGGWISATRRDELVGARGVAVTDLRPSGVGLFGDERVDVVSESSWVEAGTPIRIMAAEGYRHLVRPLPVQESAGEPAPPESSGGEPVTPESE